MKNNIPIFESIRFKIFLSFLFISILPIMYVSYTDYVEYEYKLKEATFNEIKQTSNLKSRFINNWFSYRKTDISAWSKSKINIDFLRELIALQKKLKLKSQDFVKSHEYLSFIKTKEDALILLSQQYDYIYDIFLIDIDGNILFNVTKEDDLGMPLFDEKYKNTKFASTVQKTIKNQKLNFSDIERYEPSNNLISGFMAIPLIDKNGKNIGVLAMQFYFDKIFNFFDSDIGSTDAIYYLVGEDGYLRSKINLKDEILNENIIVNSKLYNSWKNKHLNHSTMHSNCDEPFMKYVNTKDNIVFGIHQNIELLDVQWVLLSEINTDNFSLAKKNYLINTIIFLFIIILLIAIISYVLSIKITKPIDVLLKATNDYASGNRDINIKLDSKSEIGSLSKSFNKMIKALNKNENELLSKAKLAQDGTKSKSEFLASMSHEIRTPMNGVIGMLNLLNNTKLNNVQKHHTHLAISSATALIALINDILDFSKIEAGKLELDIYEYDIRDELGDFAKAIALNAQDKGVELILDLSDIEYDKIEADGDKIRQILTNIVGNSIKFTSQGYILVEISLHKVSVEDARLVAKVTDTGIGIKKDKLNTLFDSFTQVDTSTTRQYGGTGLGLSIVKKLCELMDGKIKVISEPAIGSVFEFNIAVKLSSRAKMIRPIKELKAKKILVMDSLIQSIDAIKNQLKHWEMDFEYSKTYEEALLMLSKDFFDIVLFDVKVLDKDIQKLINKLKRSSKNKNIKSIMMTPLAFNFENSIIVDKYFSKPITIKDYMNVFDIPSLEVNQQSFEIKKCIDWPKQTRILIVEDNHTNQIVAKGILEHIGLKSDIANNGEEAIQMIKNTKEVYSVVLMDCQMPIMDGYDTTKNIRAGYAGEKNKKLIIVAMTANAMTGDKEKCFSVGMNDYITKPIDLEKLKMILNKWIFLTKNTIEKKEEKKLIWDEENLFLRLGGSRELMQKVIKIFLEEINILSDKLKLAIEENNQEDIKLYAHTIKGSAANLSAFKLQDISQEIEHTLDANFNEFTNEIDKLVDIFNKFLVKNIKILDAQQVGVYDKDLFILSLNELKLLMEYESYINTLNMWIFSLKLNTKVDNELSQLKKEIKKFNTTKSIKIIENILKNIIDV